MKPPVRAFAVAAAVALSLSACGDRPDETTGAAATGERFKACMILDTGGVDDKSFNQSAWQGMQDAKAENANIDISYVQSKSEADYEPNINAQVQQQCDVVVATGGLLQTAIDAASAKNPDSNFAIVDGAANSPNVYGMLFETKPAGFLAGYLASSISKTGKIGTWGGINVGPPVTDYMDGYVAGAAYFAKQKSKPISVLGWDGKTGSFIESFQDTGKGRATTEALVQQGADVIFPVAGGAGAGAFAAAQASGGELSVIWVDFPGCTYYPEDCQYIPTSALKAIPANVKDYVVKAAAGQAPTGQYTGTLENKGTGIDAFNEWDTKISDETKAELTTIEEQIISGDLDVDNA